jgi:hypothetical protein
MIKFKRVIKTVLSGVNTMFVDIFKKLFFRSKYFIPAGSNNYLNCLFKVVLYVPLIKMSFSSIRSHIVMK